MYVWTMGAPHGVQNKRPRKDGAVFVLITAAIGVAVVAQVGLDEVPGGLVDQRLMLPFVEPPLVVPVYRGLVRSVYTRFYLVGWVRGAGTGLSGPAAADRCHSLAFPRFLRSI
jgi:hypothetical protein